MGAPGGGCAAEIAASVLLEDYFFTAFEEVSCHGSSGPQKDR